MGIAEINNNISSIKTNVPKVYEAGQNAGGGGGADYDEAYNEGYQAGYTDGEFLFKKIYSYQDLFHNAIFPDGYELELHLNSGHSFDLTSLFYNAQGLKRIKLIGGDDKVCRCGNMCHTVKSLEIFDISELNIKFSACTNFFLNDQKLKTIIGEIDLTDCTSTLNFFNKCVELEEVRFTSETIKLSISFAQSSKLSANSIQSIFDGLATVTTAQTLTLPKTLSAEAEAIVSANIEEIDGEIRIKGKEGWTLVR